MATIDFVKDFHRVFELPIRPAPTITDEPVNQLRVALLREEVNELEKGLMNEDLPNVLQELSDIQYVLDGTYLSLGLHRYKNFAFLEVHNSNMSKLGEDGKPVRREDGKIMKGPNYWYPDMNKVLESG